MVVTDSSLASEVGRNVLAAGGNAVDAAVAIAFALAVTYPTAGNIGGGGFALSFAHGETRALDFRETAPAAATRNMYTRDSKMIGEASRVGERSVAVPGSVAGLWELYRTQASQRMSWRQLLEPALRLAEQGFVVDEELEHTLIQFAKRLQPHRSSAALFYPDGAPLRRGTIWKNPALGSVLRRIAEEGRDGFYRGITAESIATHMRRHRGLITLADLDAYQPKWRAPITFSYRGARISSMPPPSSGGVTLAMMAHILEGFDLRGLGFQTAPELHFVIEAMRRAYAARNANLGDPDFVQNPLERLLSAEWATEQRATINPNQATPSHEIQSAGAASGTGPHTTHFAVVDAEGGAVSLTTTLNFAYGSGVVVEGGGFLLNNEMDDFAALPGSPNGFGLVQGEANAIAPGKRMLSSMSPCIVTGPDGKVLLIAGAAGGPTITTTVFQEISNVLDFGLGVAAAVGAPRLHMQHLPDVVSVEQGGIPTDVRGKLEAMGYALEERERIADAPMIGRSGTEWIGVAEPRRRGALAAAP